MSSRSLLRLQSKLRPNSLFFRSRQRRFASSQSQPSAHVNFYKTFGRPIAKVLLMAVFTYQLTYWAWVKLEQDDIKAQRQELAGLEAQVKSLQGSDGSKR